MWARMAKSAKDALAGNSDNPKFHEAKVVTAQYYMQRVLPATSAHLARIKSGADTMMALDAEAF